MKLLSFFALCFVYLFTLSNSFAQTNNDFKETESYEKVAQNFDNYFNNFDYDSIFEMFSYGMKKAMPLEETRLFLKNSYQQTGKIIKREFSRYEKGSYAVYKTKFEKGTAALNISVDNQCKINGLFIKPYEEITEIPTPERNQTKLILPFEGKWTVTWGGDTEKQNYHVESQSQKNAFDFLIMKNGKTYTTNAEKNEDYYAFGQEIFAPCDGEIVLSVDGIKDNKVGEVNNQFITGNTVILKTENNEYLFFAHLKQNSIKVKEGQKVKQGDGLALCGNSGHSTEPHLHFHIQNTENSNQATGIKCYFDKIIVDGKEKTDYSPIQNEVIEYSK
ncbi:peptidoglycan DD-metalloendopeptidase family protein [Bernardetia sp. MNP-M8]|uniref:peptidoglycan DD-metalloendopeptidase family protein n=1 Tax=Bernardetia sp. MNP-M8 TaxID=3127470 RepID=UPI0030D2002F